MLHVVALDLRLAVITNYGKLLTVCHMWRIYAYGCVSGI